MAQFEPYKDELQRINVQVLFIAAEKGNGFFKPAKFLTKSPVAFPFLLDEDRSVTKAYGLYHRLGKDAINIAHPATLVIDQNGIVRYLYRGANQADRAPMEQAIKAAEQVATQE